MPEHYYETLDGKPHIAGEEVPAEEELEQGLGRKYMIEQVRGKESIMAAGMKIPGWLIEMHEEIHDELGHPERGALRKTITGHVVPGTLDEEKKVWRLTAQRLKEEGKWTQEIQNIATNVLAKYYKGINNPYERARSFIESLGEW